MHSWSFHICVLCVFHLIAILRQDLAVKSKEPSHILMQEKAISIWQESCLEQAQVSWRSVLPSVIAQDCQ